MSATSKTVSICKPAIPPGREQITVGIIGAEGQMGKMLIERFTQLDYSVIGSDPKLSNGLTNLDVIDAADVVVVAVPLTEACRIMEELVHHLRPGQLILDVTSIKSRPAQILKQAAPDVAVVLSHPMCAANVNWRGQTVVVCPIRCGEWFDFVIDFYRFFGANVVIVGPRRHDEMMSVVQALPHIMCLLFVMVCRTKGLRMADVLVFATPQFRPLWLDACRLLSQNNPGLYWGIQATLPEASRQNIQQLLQEATRLLDIINTDNNAAFFDEYRAAQDFIGPDLLDDAADQFQRMTRFLADMHDENVIEVISDDDYPGLLRQITSVLAENNVNLVSLHSTVGADTRFRIATEQRRTSKEVQASIAQLRKMGWRVE